MDPNLQQMLSQQLRDVHLPEQLSWWPLAVGWWILIVCSTIAIIASIVGVIGHQRRNLYRKQALQQLQVCYLDWQSQQDTVSYLQAVNVILKRSILHIDGASNLVKVTGQRWVDGLNRLVKKSMSEQTGTALSIECYQLESTADVDIVQRDVTQWLKSHQAKMEAEDA
ncbi:MAG: DUF4381 domain-containing protein [Acidiferrobacterales bacterium]|nr:DUF4381 domain-containing protein [Acidiferrobacterales bacterium]